MNAPINQSQSFPIDDANLIDSLSSRIVTNNAFSMCTPPQELLSGWRLYQPKMASIANSLNDLDRKLRKDIGLETNGKPVPVTTRSVLNAELLARHPTMPPLVTEVEKLLEKQAKTIAMHFVKVTVSELVSSGAVGQQKAFAGGARRIKLGSNGNSVSCDVLVDDSRPQESRKEKRFADGILKLFPQSFHDQISFDYVTTMQMVDANQLPLECPDQLLVASLGPYVIGTYPDVMPKQAKNPSSRSLVPGVGALDRINARLRVAAMVLGILVPMFAIGLVQLWQPLGLRWILGTSGLTMLASVFFLLRRQAP